MPAGLAEEDLGGFLLLPCVEQELGGVSELRRRAGRRAGDKLLGFTLENLAYSNLSASAFILGTTGGEPGSERRNCLCLDGNSERGVCFFFFFPLEGELLLQGADRGGATKPKTMTEVKETARYKEGRSVAREQKEAVP